ncbi:hypothetical protein EV401DRAFT_2027723 [Pisolithus croceorrhizus]|nr:hypothetical protein EV401DRAFT_2027723 [Pisolithus croceorrhizus]
MDGKTCVTRLIVVATAVVMPVSRSVSSGTTLILPSNSESAFSVCLRYRLTMPQMVVLCGGASHYDSNHSANRRG